MQKLADNSGTPALKPLTAEERAAGEQLMAEMLGAMYNRTLPQCLGLIQQQPDLGIALAMVLLVHTTAHPHYNQNTTINDLLNLVAGGQDNLFRMLMEIEEKRKNAPPKIVKGAFVGGGVR